MRSRRVWVLALVTTVLGTGGALLCFRSTGNEDYSRIEPGLYLGSSVDRPPPGTQAVVNLCGRPDSYQVGPALWIPLYEAASGSAGEKPTLDVLRRIVGFIDEQRRAGRTTYVHCMVGVNRSGTAVTAYVMQAHRMGRDEALTFVRRRRPEVQPDPTLLQLLSEWEQTLPPAAARMNPSLEFGIRMVLVGVGATLVMDLWALLLRLFKVPSLNFSIVGRWIGHLPKGKWIHDSIAKAEPVRGEGILGWGAHYSIGITFAGVLLAVFGLEWARSPSLLPALVVGWVTVAAPLLILQPALGAGIASSKTPRPVFSSFKSLVTHTVFGIGLYLAALATAPLFRA